MDNQKKFSEYEKRMLEGIGFTIQSMDLCTIMQCPPEGCMRCPMQPIIKAQENFHNELENAFSQE